MYYTDRTFKGEQPLVKGEYENCTFIDIQLAGSDFSGYNFFDCTFESCDLSMISVERTSIQNTRFISCKMLGIEFYKCNRVLLSFSFEDCVLNFSSFYKLPLKNTLFSECSLIETEWVEADLSGATFQGCDLENAKFEATVLEATDLRSALNVRLDPELNRMEGALFSPQNALNLLHKYKIRIE